MKKIASLLFLISSLCSATLFAQEAPGASAQATTPNSNTIFGMKIGEPINVPRCDPYIAPIETPKTCYVVTNDTSLLYEKRVQNIQIYFPRDLKPQEVLQQRINGSLYKNNLVLLQISTAGASNQTVVMDALKKIFGQPIIEKTIEAGSTAPADSIYLPGSLFAEWSTPTTEIFFGGGYKSSKRGMIRINLKMDAIETLDTAKKN